MPILVLGQQFPFMEGYTVNSFSLSPSYAGIHNTKTLFIDYRSDWSGIDGGPATYQLSYNDKLYDKLGLGIRFIYDKTDIFKQTLILGTYTYEIHATDEHILNFGLSLGFYRNSVDFTKYYNDPTYVQDLALIYGHDKSKLKFATDISFLHRYRQLESGILFSNLMFGITRYRNTDMTYKPFKNYLIHSSRLFAIDDTWSIKPAIILRGGQHIPLQIEMAARLSWHDRFWGTAAIRTGRINGLGLGGEVYQGILLNYSYSMSSNVTMTPFSSHQLTLGVRIFDFMKGTKVQE